MGLPGQHYLSIWTVECRLAVNRKRFALRFHRLVLILTLLAIFTMAVRVSTDSDTFWHLRAGSWMAENRQILRTDPFSLTRYDQPWAYPGWLAQITLFGIFKGLGYVGLNLFTALMVVLAFGLMWSALEGTPLLRAFVLVLAAAASAVYWAARPHIITFALSAAFLLILELVKRGRTRLLWILPALMILWVNVHGGFVFGFMLLVLYLAGELVEFILAAVQVGGSIRGAWNQRRTLILGFTMTGLGCAAASVLNPHGIQMLAYPFKTVSIGVLQDFIQEWQSPNFHHTEVQPFLWLLFISIAALALSPLRKTAAELLLLLVMGYMSFLAARNIAQFALVAALILARHAQAAFSQVKLKFGAGKQVPPRVASVINWIILVLACFISVVKIASVSTNDVNQQAIEASQPTGAVAYLQRERPPGPLFNSYNWGGYVLWELYPEYLSFVDGRTDLFDDEILESYLQAWRAGSGWESVLEEWGIRLVLLESDAPLVEELRDHGWQLLYADEQAVILSGQDA
jgi:hypothetical protein